MERFRDIVYERIHEVKNLNVKISDLTDHIFGPTSELFVLGFQKTFTFSARNPQHPGKVS